MRSPVCETSFVQGVGTFNGDNEQKARSKEPAPGRFSVSGRCHLYLQPTPLRFRTLQTSFLATTHLSRSQNQEPGSRLCVRYCPVLEACFLSRVKKVLQCLPRWDKCGRIMYSYKKFVEPSGCKRIHKFRLPLSSSLFLYELNSITQGLWKQTEIEMCEGTLISPLEGLLFYSWCYSAN